jgi:hypothetical protein
MPTLAIENMTRALISALPKLLLMVATARRAEEAQATRAEMRRRLIAYAGAAESILELLEAKDPQALAHIDAAGPACMSIEELDGVAESLRNLAERARRAARPAKASGKNKRDAGSGRAWADQGAPSAKDLCAMIVRVIFEHSGAQVPKPSNKHAIAMAAQIWAAAGGELSAWKREGKAATGWIKHFQRAATLIDRPEHKTISRLLVHRVKRMVQSSCRV